MPDEAAAENEAALRRFYAAFEHDPYAEHVHACLTHDAIWHIAGAHPLAGAVVGAHAVVARMLAFEQASGGSLRLDTAIVATPTHAVAIHAATACLSATRGHVNGSGARMRRSPALPLHVRSCGDAVGSRNRLGGLAVTPP